MTFGEDFGLGTSRDVSARILDMYADAGNVVDTASIYTGGTSERLLKGRQDRFLLAAKYSGQSDPADSNTASLAIPSCS
jgi:aryl-alcohol dehydrogenase-like predicted oxidoreductase